MEQKVRKLEDFNAEDRIDLKLLENNTYFLNGEISEESVGACAKWLICENLDVTKEKVLTLYINSTGGRSLSGVWTDRRYAGQSPRG